MVNTLPSHTLKNYIYLSDERNMPKNYNQDMTMEKTIVKVTKVRELIKNLGFNGVYDTKAINKETIDINIKKARYTEIFGNIKDTKILFDIDNRVHNKPFATDKSRLSYLNTILKPFAIQIKSKQKGKQKIPHYTLERKHSIDEIMVYKKLNGHKIHVRADTVKTFMYAQSYDIKPLAVRNEKDRLLAIEMKKQFIK